MSGWPPGSHAAYADPWRRGGAGVWRSATCAYPSISASLMSMAVLPNTATAGSACADLAKLKVSWSYKCGSTRTGAMSPTSLTRRICRYPRHTAALAVFARHPRVERYAWYPWNTNNELVSSSGSLTSLGKAVAAAPKSK